MRSVASALASLGNACRNARRAARAPANRVVSGACVATPVAIFVADCTHQAILLIDDVTTFSIGAPSSVLSYVGSEYDLDVG